jgi:hypothetical protein
LAALDRHLADLVPTAPILHASHRPIALRGLDGTSRALDDLQGTAVAALTSIARPERFVATLAHLGARVVQSFAFPDHHEYRPEDLAATREAARAADAELLVTTAKDAVKLSAPADAMPPLAVLDIELTLPEEDAARLDRLIADLGRETPRPAFAVPRPRNRSIFRNLWVLAAFFGFVTLAFAYFYHQARQSDYRERRTVTQLRLRDLYLALEALRLQGGSYPEAPAAAAPFPPPDLARRLDAGGYLDEALPDAALDGWGQPLLWRRRAAVSGLPPDFTHPVLLYSRGPDGRDDDAAATSDDILFNPD